MAFEGLSAKLQAVINKLKGKSRITEADVKEITREVKLALLEADVNFKIVKDFTTKIGEKMQNCKYFLFFRIFYTLYYSRARVRA